MTGDNAEKSSDSRSWGYVPEERLIGKVIFILWSWDEFGATWWSSIRWSRIGRVF
jgi:signal peptidase I